jgi:hypothetical protein
MTTDNKTDPNLIDLLLAVRMDHPDCENDSDLINYMIDEVKREHLFVDQCIQYACCGVMDDYRAQEAYHRERGAKQRSAPLPQKFIDLIIQMQTDHPEWTEEQQIAHLSKATSISSAANLRVILQSADLRDAKAAKGLGGEAQS